MGRFILIKNIVSCVKCGDIVESKYTHDFVKCKCGAIATDGGREYQRIVGDENDIRLDKTIFKDQKNGSYISYNELEQFKQDVKELMKLCNVQNVGSGFIDCICKKDRIANFLDELSKIEVDITHFTLWEVVDTNDEKSEVGMGGLMNQYGEGWFAEIDCNYFEYKDFDHLFSTLNKYEQELDCDLAPGLWLDI